VSVVQRGFAGAAVVAVVSHGDGREGGCWARWARSGGDGAWSVERQIALGDLVSWLGR
jgi:hypothetical protein